MQNEAIIGSNFYLVLWINSMNCCFEILELITLQWIVRYLKLEISYLFPSFAVVIKSIQLHTNCNWDVAYLNVVQYWGKTFVSQINWDLRLRKNISIKVGNLFFFLRSLPRLPCKFGTHTHGNIVAFVAHWDLYIMTTVGCFTNQQCTLRNLPKWK